jgi:hypothetical protein
MRELLIAAVVTAAGLAVPVISIGFAGDRVVLVPPPEARAEAFAKALAAYRPEIALGFLSNDLRRRHSATALGEAFDRLRQSAGGFDNVSAEGLRYDRHRATARVHLKGRNAISIPLELTLVWEQGAWVLDEMPPALK